MSLLRSARNESPDSGNNEIWNVISGWEEVESILQISAEKPQLIYKHSDRCSVCFLAKQELEDISDKVNESADLHMVDVIKQRDVSDAIASKLNVRHESPQVILLKNREVLWNGSHWDIKGKEVLKKLGDD